jgi:hypothetical protein
MSNDKNGSMSQQVNSNRDRIKRLEDSSDTQTEDTNSIKNSIGKIETSIALIAQQLNNYITLEARVRAMEDLQNRTNGGIKVLICLGGIVGGLISWIISFFTHRN